MIDWSRVARPQPDSYDCQAAMSLRGELPYVESATKIFDTVAVTDCPRSLSPQLTNADPQHPNIKEAERLVNLWPEGAASFKYLMREFHPLALAGLHGRGSTCGSDESQPGKMYATVHSAPGLAEAFLHEMGHSKLRYLGIHLEHADRLIANGPDELFVSPLRKDKLRPMSAVVHAEFSYTYVTALDLMMRDSIEALKINRDRIAEGREVMQQNLKCDEDGKRFFAGFFDWLDEVIEKCDSFLSSSRQTAPG
jgi:HEXXH motif-containing protein